MSTDIRKKFEPFKCAEWNEIVVHSKYSFMNVSDMSYQQYSTFLLYSVIITVFFTGYGEFKDKFYKLNTGDKDS